MTTRMIDLMMREGGWMRDIVSHSPPFSVDNVYRYMTTDPDMLYDWSDFPNLAPPFSQFWMEYETRDGQPGQGRTYHLQSGVSVHSARLPEDREDLLEQCGEQSAAFRAQMEAFIEIGEDPRWVLDFVLFDRRSEELLTDEDEVKTFARVSFLIKADGTLASEKVATTMYLGNKDGDPDPMHNTLRKYLFAGLCPYLMSISFMHCKNVIHVERKAPRAERRRAEKEKILPPVTYKTLVIEPLTRVLHTEGGRSKGESIKKAMHICRGHFKHFDEKPLFGKHRGMYFWNDQVRARNSDRAVAKRYDVHAARDESGIATYQIPPTTTGED